MNIIQGLNIDLIEPFPVSETHRVFGWTHTREGHNRYSTVLESDEGPRTLADYEQHMNSLIPLTRSFGVIDKNHLAVPEDRHEAPLIGMIIFEPSGRWNGYFHVASTRRSWGKGLMDEAGVAAIKEIFTSMPDLTRVSAYMAEKNYMARGLAKRVGLQWEGVFRDFLVNNGHPVSCAHYGLTRKSWNEKCLGEKSEKLDLAPLEPQPLLSQGEPALWPPSEPSGSEQAEPPLVPLVEVESKGAKSKRKSPSKPGI